MSDSAIDYSLGSSLAPEVVKATYRLESEAISLRSPITKTRTAGEPQESTRPAKESSDKPVVLAQATDANNLLPGQLPERLGYPLDDLGRLGTSREELERVREEIRQHGKEPRQAVIDLIRQNRVLALGETHLSPNPQRDFGASIIKDLKDAGATHLAIEADKQLQPILDEFMRTGNLDIKALPFGLRDPDFISLLNNAREAGLRIVAVDDHSDENRRDGTTRVTRDQHMANNISDILKENSNNKVVFWVGSGHLTRISDANVNREHRSASEILRDRYSVATVVPNIDRLDASTLTQMTPDLTRPTLVRTGDAPHLSRLRSSALEIPKDWYGDVDYVLLYPPTRR